MSSSINVNIKNSGKTYPLELQLNDNSLKFKQLIQQITKIPIERQKILLKSGQLNNNDTLISELNLKNNQIIMVLGSPELNLPIPPIFDKIIGKNSKPLFKPIEPIGLENLGNTCYLNSTIQILNNLENLEKKLNETQIIGEIGSNENLIYQLQKILKFLQNPGKLKSIIPEQLITSLRYLYPQFNERDQYGRFKQQDAEEVFSQLLTSLTAVLGDEFIEDFKINFKSTVKNLEDESDVEIKFESDLKLQCHITSQTNFLKNGIENSLNDSTIEKFSSNLNKNCNYQIDKKIVKLPKILTVQFVRFFWKKSTNKKSKILRKVTFPFQLDLNDLLDDQYKDSKIKIRDELRSLEKEKLNEIQDFKKLKKSTVESLEFLNAKNSKYLHKYKEIFPKDLSLGENPSSLYELSAIITHQGSSADSGHYQAFVKDKIDDSKWWRFNDDKVSIVDREKIESLAGGGESDSALILIYKGFGTE
ncbi:hypothetical protein WICMUC_004634 [Wickerhamomyces mucosus]|uniref:Ubiquitin carboxyl-terminal hydrolase n=1 Tax=Wickerhamomyces mucosus TaxID=1378264 RepID=A0A9P8PFS7_9ASCO|nr:hypothetical protein WICMUC_004634 [Wickerhamomyces mucosus]